MPPSGPALLAALAALTLSSAALPHSWRDRVVARPPGAPARPTPPVTARLTLAAAAPSDPAHDTHRVAGSAWFAARVTLPDGTVAATPDASATDRLGLSPAVQRVSFRADDTFLGWLSTYFHVTSVFGSNGP